MRFRLLAPVLAVLAASGLPAPQSGDSGPTQRLRWSAGAPNCFEVGAPEHPVRAIKGPRIEVGAMLEDTGSKLRVLVVVVNLGTAPLRFDPATFTLHARRPKARELAYVPPPSTLQPHVPKPLPPESSQGSGLPPRLDPHSNRFEVMEQSTPRTEAPAPMVRPELAEMMSTALWPGVVHPGRGVRGAVYFKRYKQFESGTFRARVGGYEVEIPLDKPVRAKK